jgi:hypothetical protein
MRPAQSAASKPSIASINSGIGKRLIFMPGF